MQLSTTLAIQEPEIKAPADGATLLFNTMAAGDPQRIWFEEMVDTLRSKWRRDMPFEAIIDLRDELDAMLQHVRSERQIRPPVFRCSKCGYIGEKKRRLT